MEAKDRYCPWKTKIQALTISDTSIRRYVDTIGPEGLTVTLQKWVAYAETDKCWYLSSESDYRDLFNGHQYSWTTGSLKFELKLSQYTDDVDVGTCVASLCIYLWKVSDSKLIFSNRRQLAYQTEGQSAETDSGFGIR